MKVRNVPAGWIGVAVILGAWSFALASCTLGRAVQDMSREMHGGNVTPDKEDKQ